MKYFSQYKLYRFLKDYIILTNVVGLTFVWGRHLLAHTMVTGINASK